MSDSPKTFVSEGITVLKPGWTTIQQAVCVATRAAEDAQGAWVRYYDAKQRLQQSKLGRQVEALEAEWHKKNAYKNEREAHRDEVLKAALGISLVEEEAVA